MEVCETEKVEEKPYRWRDGVLGGGRARPVGRNLEMDQHVSDSYVKNERKKARALG
jgi:predicted methyltransferase MtxX (methanogen marker protein 4)